MIEVTPRMQELALKNLLGTISAAEKEELKLLAKDAKAEIRANAKNDPDAIIERLQAKITKIQETIAYVQENGKLPEKVVELDENGEPIKSKRGRKPKAVVEDAEDFTGDE